jgi:hypothetical protein
MSTLLQDYLSENDLAAELNKTVRTIQLWRSRREGPPWVRIGKTPVYHRAAVLRWLEQQQVEPVRAHPTA